ncbi:hypothetical protein C7974DRAFT_402614 [Boeremia exigua]|uniref:uncharacterized protein n=1 Tax=Boeremia exigua TaxID=749465 RepID=UPI001E8CAE2E|nr:uncharacterized protein C7974DRAFT_402614 [Boeremia exigua]KAH6616894.1 hypothetical protein C7974DRAFT_402614 [Boeremia exigua]
MVDQLPQELIDRISRCLPTQDLKNTLLLSHAFRFSAEKYSGAFTSFDFDKDTAERFLSIYSGHRLLYLRDLRCAIRLPPPADSARRDNADQLRKHDMSFTEQITLLFKTVKSVEERAGNHGPGKIRLAISPLLRPIFRELSLSYHDHLSWRIHLLDPEALPILNSIRSLEVGDDWGGSSSVDDADHDQAHVKLDCRAMVDLVVKLPNLEYWGCRIGGDEWSPKTEQEATRYLTQDWAGPRRDTRQDFARALLSARLPKSLQRVRLDFLYNQDQSTYIDHLTPQPDLVSPAPNDLFSTSLHQLSHHLRRLRLCVVADETLFCPKDSCSPPWPNLESLVVMFHMVAPSGKWYFVGPNGEGRDTAVIKITDAAYPPLETTPYDEEMIEQIEDEGDWRYRGSPNTRCRIVPNHATLRPFLAAFAKAVLKMKALQEAVLWCPLVWAAYNEDGEELETDCVLENGPDKNKLAWGVHYQALNERTSTRQGESTPADDPLLWWKVGKWRPDPELHQLFRQFGCSSSCDGVKEQWEDEDYGDRLVDRDYFERCVQEEVDKVGHILPPN